MNYLLLCRLLSVLLLLFTLSMLIAVPFALYYGEWKSLLVFVESMGIGLIFTGILYLFGRRATGEVYRREALATVGLSWIIAAAIGAIPFILSGAVPDIASAYFESASGMTTTGSSVFEVIEDKPKSILIWRSFLHFLGGLGIVVLFVAILPAMGVGGRALFKQEVPGPVTEGLTPRIRDTAIKLLKLYIGLNVVQAIILMICGMSFFDAINHAMATIATGGFSTKNASIAAFTSPMVEWVTIVFMFLAGTNFSLHLEALKGRFVYFKSIEFRVYLFIVFAVSFFIATMLWMSGSQAVSNSGGFNFRDAMFITLAIQTTTGFGTVDFDQWPEVTRILLVFLMFVGGCAGSTGGGIKLVRWIMVTKVVLSEIATNVSPRSVRLLKLDNHVINKETSRQVLTFVVLYLMLTAAGAITVALLMPEQSLVTSVTASVTALNNIGPGLELIGPTSNFASQSAPTKWVLSFLMIMGRLELFSVLVLLSPKFWVR